jgi:DNA repair photolyase
VLSLVRQTRNGALYDSRFGTRQTGTGAVAEMIAQRFRIAMRRFGLEGRGNMGAALDCTQFRVPPELETVDSRQLALL